MIDNKKLIEEAAAAIWLVRYGTRVGWIEAPENWRSRVAPQTEDEIQREAEAALAVFEKALTPTVAEGTSDEREGPKQELCGRCGWAMSGHVHGQYGPDCPTRPRPSFRRTVVPETVATWYEDPESDAQITGDEWLKLSPAERDNWIEVIP